MHAECFNLLGSKDKINPRILCIWQVVETSAFSALQEAQNEPEQLARQEGDPVTSPAHISDGWQMTALIGVLAAFSLMFLSDLLKLKARKTAGNSFFLTGILLLAGSLVYASFSSGWFPVPLPLRLVFLLLAVLFAALELHTLFFALPAKQTYLTKEQTTLVDSGIYALCRHPGALWLPAFLLFFSLGIGSLGLVIAGILASMLNLLYVWFQDSAVFPRTIPGYAEYQLRIPFLLPTWQRTRSALTGLLRRQE